MTPLRDSQHSAPALIDLISGHLQSQIPKWSRVIREANIKL
jgi:hypothetical protein